MRISGDCFANFVADFHTTFVPVLHECHKYFMCRELVTKFLNLFKNFMRFFSPKYFARLSRYSWDVRGSVANLSPQNFGKFTMQNFCDARMNVVRVWYEVRTTVLRKKKANTSRLSGEKIKLSNIDSNVTQLLYE